MFWGDVGNLMKCGYWVILALCLFTSCHESEKVRISRLVKEWDGRKILFPVGSVFTVQGQDTVDFSFRDADYKVLTYVDSLGCTSCKLQLSRWRQFVEEVDTTVRFRVPFVFYLHPKDKKELRYLTRRDGFSHPVCFDEHDSLNILNRFPSDMTFQTFLLDKSDRVVAIGNPVLNPQVKSLYLQVLTGHRQVADTDVRTTVEADRELLDFGQFPKSEKQERSFFLTNTGNRVLVIHDVVTSCGCTRVEYSKEGARPGGRLELKVIYDAEEPGRFSKTITVYCNAENSPLRLKIRGEAE